MTPMKKARLRAQARLAVCKCGHARMFHKGSTLKCHKLDAPPPPKRKLVPCECTRFHRGAGAA